MKKDEKQEEDYRYIKEQHAILERRLKMLLKRPYLTEEEEREMKVLKKRKLYYKDLMEKRRQSIGKKEKD
jgi:hypothetical protein